MAHRLDPLLRPKSIAIIGASARGDTPVALDALCEIASKFSVMVHALGNTVSEIDINPIIVTDQGATAVDALVVGSAVSNGMSE